MSPSEAELPSIDHRDEPVDGRLPGDGRALAAVAAQFWINGMVYGAVIPRLPDIRDRLDIGLSALGLVLTAGAVGGLLGSAVSARVVSRLGTRRSIVIGTVATLFVLPTVGFSRSVVVVVAALAAMALLDVIIDIGMNVQGSTLNARRATPVMNRLHGLWSLGTVVGGLVAVRATAAEVPLWQHLLAVAGLLALTLAISGRHLLSEDDPDVAPAPDPEQVPDPVPDLDLDPSAEPVGDDHQACGQESPGQLVGDVPGANATWSGWRTPVVLAVLAMAAIIMEQTTTDWAAFRLADDLGMEPGLVGFGFVAFTGGMVVGRFSGDWLQSRLGPMALLQWASLLAAAGLLVATVAPGDFLVDAGFGPSATGWLAVAGFFVSALGVSVIFPQLYDRAAQAEGPPGRALAAMTGGMRVAALAAPAVVGALADTGLTVGAAVAIMVVPSCALTGLWAWSAGRRAAGPDRGVAATIRA